MADLMRAYDHTFKLWINGQVDKANIKAMLLDATGTYNAAHTTIDSVAGAVTGGHRPKEVYGNGWTEGGEVLASVAVTIWNTNGYMIDAADTRKTATTGGIGPYDHVLIYDATNNLPLWHIVNEVPGKTAGAATDNVIVYNAGGIQRGSIT